MTTKEWIYKFIEVGTTVIAALIMVPLLLLLTLTTAIGAVVYIPFHFWAMVRQSARSK